MTYSELLQISSGYNDVIRKICFEYSAGGYNSDGFIEPSRADDKLRWIIDDVRRAAIPPSAGAPVSAAEQADLSKLTRYEPKIAPMLYDYVAEMIEREDGDWVRFADVEALAALAAAMRQPQGDEQTMRSLIEDAVANHNSPEGYIKLCMTYFRHGSLAAKQGEKGGAA
jgi:hypothetical protein